MSEGKTTDEKLAVVAKAVLEVAAMAAIKGSYVYD